MQDTIDFHRRASFAKIVGVGALGVGALSGVKLQAEEINEATEQIRKQNYININPLYVDSDKVLLPKMQMKLQKHILNILKC